MNRRLAEVLHTLAAVDWHIWAMAVIGAVAVGYGAVIWVRIATGRDDPAPDDDPAGDVRTMGEQVADDWAAAGYVRPEEPTRINLGEYALTPAVEQRAPAGPTPPLLLDLRPPSGEYPTVATQAPARLRAPWTGPRHDAATIQHHAVPGGWRTGPDGLPVPIWMPDRLTGPYHDLIAREAASREGGEPPC